MNINIYKLSLLTITVWSDTYVALGIDRIILVLDPKEHAVGVQPSTGKPVFIRPELKDGPLARAAAAAAQRPAVPGGVLSAQPQDIDQAAQASESNTSAQQTGAVQRLRQQYEGTTPEEPATLAEEVCTQGCVLYCMWCMLLSSNGATVCHAKRMAQRLPTGRHCRSDVLRLKLSILVHRQARVSRGDLHQQSKSQKQTHLPRNRQRYHPILSDISVAHLRLHMHKHMPSLEAPYQGANPRAVQGRHARLCRMTRRDLQMGEKLPQQHSRELQGWAQTWCRLCGPSCPLCPRPVMRRRSLLPARSRSRWGTRACQ